MRDVQGERDPRNIPIDRVGIRNLSYPILVMDRQNKVQPTIASVSMSVLLPHEYRGTHMSRFVEVLDAHRERISLSTLELLARHLREKLSAEESTISLKFPYFIRKKAPVSGMESLMRYGASIEAMSRENDFDIVAGVEVPVQTLCPCSKEISEHGAHNQRALISLRVRCPELVWFEELIQMAEASASAPLFALLKREDEKYVTELAYETPRFVEDVVRELALTLDREERVVWYSLSVVSSESIHDHDAFAEIVRDKRRSGERGQ